MSFVVTEACIQCKYTDCVSVCPMDCFFEGPNFLVIHPDECIDCSICVAECPVGAIVSDHEIDESQRHFVDINRRLSADPRYQRISRAKEPMPEHGKWAAVKNKLNLLEIDESVYVAESNR